MKISIPKPCHEDWKTMTPTEKGAFCGVCQKDVIDFTQKTNAEIRSILMASNGEKLCGNFLNIQLEEGYDTFTEWENQSVTTFRSKFLWACVVAFGLTLFTGCDQQTAEEINGDIEGTTTDSTKTSCDLYTTDATMGEMEVILTDDSSIPSACFTEDSLANCTKGKLKISD